MSTEKQRKNADFLPDEEIVSLYWNRDERAIRETDRKYRRYLHTIAYNVLHDNLDCEECLNDTYLGTWNRIPPTWPTKFQIFIAKIMRNIAIKRFQKKNAAKRVPSEMVRSLDELDECLPATPSLEEEYLLDQLAEALNEYLQHLDERKEFVFMCRYYCSDRIAKIAEMLGVSDSTVFRDLSEIREELKRLLIEGGYFDDEQK